MTYCSAAGLEDDFRALQDHNDPFKAARGATSSHKNKTQALEKLKWSTGDRSLIPNSVMTFLLLDCPTLSHNPLSVNNKCTCTGLVPCSPTKKCTLHSLLA